MLAGGFALQARATRGGAQLLDQVLTFVALRYVDTLDAQALYEKAARGLVKEHGDPYTELFTPKQMEEFSRNTNGPLIPDAERDVLSCLVQMEQATVKELRDALLKTRPMQASSVLTLLNRLEARKLVTKRKSDQGKAFIFRPTKASSRTMSRLLKNLFQQAFGGDTMAFMTSFFETRKPTASEIEQLQKLLDDLKAAHPKQEDDSHEPTD